MLTGQEPPRISTKAKVFLYGKGEHEERERNTVIQTYGFEDRPFLLTKFVLDR